MAEGGVLVNVEAVHQTLKVLRILRLNVSQVFEGLAEGLKSTQGDETKEKAVLVEFQQALQNVNAHVRDLDVVSSNLVAPSAPFTLGNSGLLSQDPAPDRASLYLQMIQSYKWTDKVREFAGHAAQLLGQNSLKRSILITKRSRKAPQNSHNIPTQWIYDTFTMMMLHEERAELRQNGIVDNVISNCERVFPNMHIAIERPYGTSSILKITLSKTLKAVLVLRSLIIEWVVVKAFNEDLQTEDGKIDVWSNSKYSVFRKVTDHANAAMLHYYAPTMPDVAIKSFMMWLQSYSSLFTAPCHRCGNYLNDFLPPTWRDFRTLDAYHEACR